MLCRGSPTISENGLYTDNIGKQCVELWGKMFDDTMMMISILFNLILVLSILFHLISVLSNVLFSNLDLYFYFVRFRIRFVPVTAMLLLC